MKPKEMTIAFMTPQRNQLMIDRMVLAVQEFAMKHAGLDKLVIEVHDCSELKKKDETIQILISALEQYEDMPLDKIVGYCDVHGEIYDAEYIAREVLKEIRPEPLIIIDEVLKGDDDGKI